MTMFGNHDLTGILKASWLVSGGSFLSAAQVATLPASGSRGAAVNRGCLRYRVYHFESYKVTYPRCTALTGIVHTQPAVKAPEQYDAASPAVWNLRKPTYRPRWP